MKDDYIAHGDLPIHDLLSSSRRGWLV